ncbi:glycosyltransferase [Paenibacillus agri]|uniref:Glycosyltransferase n=1 Tax=Paenibacillus agri TaxID=2744309 RepID=A0A850EE69_9BACL|nr:glycosyltransferase [Paenibacillus agri]NUU59018.1 glycosyltransferase [Paenibacillus agri]
MRKRLLFLSARTHSQEDGEGWIRTRSILEMLLEKYDVDLLLYGNYHTADLPEAAGSLTVHQVKMTGPLRGKKLGSLYTPGRRFYPGNMSKEMKLAIAELCHMNSYSHAFLSYNLPGSYLDILNRVQPGITLIMDAFQPRTGRTYLKTGRKRIFIKPYDHLNAARLRKDMQRTMNKTALLLAASEWDALSFKAVSFEDAGKVQVLPSFINLDKYEKAEPVGKVDGVVLHWNMSTPQGKRAALLFQQNILPAVREKVPGSKFYITSNLLEPEILESLKEEKNVFIAASAEEAIHYIRQSKVLFAPLLEGIEARPEILESWALKTPVVTTFRGSETLICEHKQNILTAKTIEEIAQSIVTLLQDQELGAIIADRAFQTLLKHYEFTDIKQKVLSLV